MDRPRLLSLTRFVHYLPVRPVLARWIVQRTVGIAPGGEPLVSEVAPFRRFAYQATIGENFFEVGTFGLCADVHPASVKRAGFDRMLDPGLDASTRAT